MTMITAIDISGGVVTIQRADSTKTYPVDGYAVILECRQRWPNEDWTNEDYEAVVIESAARAPKGNN